MENYQRQLDKILEEISRQPGEKRLLLHSCCAPCSSYVLEYLARYFTITVYYYNPNITQAAEYEMRVEEQRRLIARMPLPHPVTFQEGAYEPERYFEAVRGMEDEPEGGLRCFACYRLRLLEAARVAAEVGFDYFTTTLSISPMKNAEKLNIIGNQAGERYGVAWLPSDFKKKNGYKRSVELSGEYALYRQNYCGCVFSKRDSCGKLER